MADQVPSPRPPAVDSAGSGPAPPDPGLTPAGAARDERERGERVEALLVRSDLRDVAAAQRDRLAHTRGTARLDDVAVAREWAARDRDLAAADRADLIEILGPHGDRRVDQRR